MTGLLRLAICPHLPVKINKPLDEIFRRLNAAKLRQIEQTGLLQRRLLYQLPVAQDADGAGIGDHPPGV